MSGSNPSSQASPNPSPEDNDRQVQIDTVQKELQELKTAIEVPEGSGRVTAINKAAEELSNAMKPILSLSEEDRNEKEVALIKEILNDSKVETVLRDLIERVGTSRTDLQGLAAEVNAGDLTNELAAMEGNPENASTSFVVSFLANVDSVLKKFSSNDSLGERGKGFAQMMHNAMSQFVLATLEKFSSISFFGQKASLLSEVDKMALAKRRLEEDRATLDVDPAVKKKYKESVHDPLFFKAYSAWIVAQKVERPTLISIVNSNGAPSTVASNAEAEKKSDVFPDDGIERIVSDGDDIKVVLGSLSINLKKNDVLFKSGDLETKCNFVRSNSKLSVQKITRGVEEDTVAGNFKIFVDDNFFTFDELNEVFDKVKEGNSRKLITNTGIYLEKIVTA